MSKAAILKLIIYILGECVAHGKDVAEVLFGKGKIEDSELYRRQPKARKVAMLRAWRSAQRALKK